LLPNQVLNINKATRSILVKNVPITHVFDTDHNFKPKNGGVEAHMQKGTQAKWRHTRGIKMPNIASNNLNI
jgi:uncharacterized protein YukJ